MRRLVIALAGAVAAGGIAATPALAGLAGNPSFSQQIPVPIPSGAQSGSLAGQRGSQHAEPGDDRGGLSPTPGPGTTQPGVAPAPAPSDDHGGANPSAEVSESHGGGGGGPGPGSGVTGSGS